MPRRENSFYRFIGLRYFSILLKFRGKFPLFGRVGCVEMTLVIHYHDYGFIISEENFLIFTVIADVCGFRKNYITEIF